MAFHYTRVVYGPSFYLVYSFGVGFELNEFRVATFWKNWKTGKSQGILQDLEKSGNFRSFKKSQGIFWMKRCQKIHLFCVHSYVLFLFY